MAGFSELIPQDLINVFDERELELLIGGMSEIDVYVTLLPLFPSFTPDAIIISDDWSKFTDYRGYEMTDEVIQWFWQCVRGWPAERKSRLLQFATGTSRIPVNGFKDLQGSDGPRRFTIEKSGDPSQLPKSHTCFNRIDLPPYRDYATLENKLTLAVEYVHHRPVSRYACLSVLQGNCRFWPRVDTMLSGVHCLMFSALFACTRLPVVLHLYAQFSYLCFHRNRVAV